MAMREAGHDYNCVKWLHAKSVNCCFINNICALFVTGVFLGADTSSTAGLLLLLDNCRG